MIFTSQSYDFDAIEHAEAALGLESLCKMLWESYGQFLRKSKLSSKGRGKKVQLQK